MEIKWKAQRGVSFETRQLQSDITRLTPEATEALIKAGDNFRIVQRCELQGTASLLGSAGVRTYLKKVVFRWKLRAPRYSRNNAHAEYTRHVVAFNPWAILKFKTALTTEEYEARIVDLIMHEIAHLLTWNLMGTSGHNSDWRLWATVSGFVGIGCTDLEKKVRRSLALRRERLGLPRIPLITRKIGLAAEGETPSLKVWETIPESKNPADLTRQGLLAGISPEAIVSALRTVYPDYKAYKIAVSVYRRELQKKGLLP
jgi:hypothetical protein